ncbi:MAG: glutamine--tRNA ligase/YqeY domain fusion protein [Candidatus Mycalebacterium zealandia]|nr:MAG: glutamine--tRNA ligase/YqeY domain fusion protein [Candidatus Mycalebacterium zealandia]
MTDSGKKDFIREIIAHDSHGGKKIVTRFPPEPNGFLHIGHAKSICLNFSVAEGKGTCNLRFDDTNPQKESEEFIEAIKNDIQWLGFDWEDRLFFASDYFEKLYEFAVNLIENDSAYVDDLSAEEIRQYRGTLTEPGRNSPFRNRTANENLTLFKEMKERKFSEGEKVLRAKIDMTSGNINMRDPVIYRVIKTPHHKTGEKWSIYPTYDFAHPLSDAIEGITHSLCTLEFEDHRPLYNWFVERFATQTGGNPCQIEFARLELSHTVMSKRKLSEIVEKNIVNGWDDPRMPTISGMRRRGYPPEAIRSFCDKIGVTKQKSVIEADLLEHTVRETLNKIAPRRMAVLEPLKLVITNFPQDEEESLPAVNNPEDPGTGERQVPFSRELYIEHEDFMENPSKKFHRLAPGAEVRLRYAYFVTCVEVVKDSNGKVTELHCEYDPETKGGQAPDGRKVKATIHWVSAKHCKKAQVRLYDKLFTEKTPGVDDPVNPNSLRVLNGVLVEPSLENAKMGDVFQFERKGYFAVDEDSSNGEEKIFNETVGIRGVKF